MHVAVTILARTWLKFLQMCKCRTDRHTSGGSFQGANWEGLPVNEKYALGRFPYIYVASLVTTTQLVRRAVVSTNIPARNDEDKTEAIQLVSVASTTGRWWRARSRSTSTPHHIQLLVNEAGSLRTDGTSTKRTNQPVIGSSFIHTWRLSFPILMVMQLARLHMLCPPLDRLQDFHISRSSSEWFWCLMFWSIPAALPN